MATCEGRDCWCELLVSNMCALLTGVGPGVIIGCDTSRNGNGKIKHFCLPYLVRLKSELDIRHRCAFFFRFPEFACEKFIFKQT